MWNWCGLRWIAEAMVSVSTRFINSPIYSCFHLTYILPVLLLSHFLFSVTDSLSTAQEDPPPRTLLGTILEQKLSSQLAAQNVRPNTKATTRESTFNSDVLKNAESNESECAVNSREGSFHSCWFKVVVEITSRCGKYYGHSNKGRLWKNSEIATLISNWLSIENKAKLS